MEKAISFPARVFRGISWQISQIFHLVEKHTCKTYISDFFIFKMFSKQRENTFESEKSSDDEIANFRRKVINRISSSSDSDIEEAFAGEDIKDMLEELAIDEEEKFNSIDNSLNNIQWNEFANRQQTFPFTGKSGHLMDLPFDISANKCFRYSLMKKC